MSTTPSDDVLELLRGSPTALTEPEIQTKMAGVWSPEAVAGAVSRLLARGKVLVSRHSGKDWLYTNPADAILDAAPKPPPTPEELAVRRMGKKRRPANRSQWAKQLNQYIAARFGPGQTVTDDELADIAARRPDPAVTGTLPSMEQVWKVRVPATFLRLLVDAEDVAEGTELSWTTPKGNTITAKKAVSGTEHPMWMWDLSQLEPD